MNRSYSKIRHIQEANILLEQRRLLMKEQVTTVTTTIAPAATTQTTTVPTGTSSKSSTSSTSSTSSNNRPPCIGNELNSLGCWLDEIDRVQREIGNPKTWTMDSYNRLQKTLNDYKTWRTTTPEGKAVKDNHNVEGEYVVQLPDHLKNAK